MVENRGPQLAAAIIVFLVLSWTTTMLRCFVRVKLIKNFAMDDWLTLLTLALFTMYAGFVLDGIYWGTGMHMQDLTVQQKINGMKAWWACEMIYIIDTAVLRLAVAAFLLRIALNKIHRQVIYSMVALNVTFNLYFVIVTVVQCSPPTFFFTRFDGRHMGSCNVKLGTNSTYAQSAISALIDWTYGTLPVFIIWDLKMNKRKKILVALVLSLAALASAATIIRLPFVYTLTHSQDFLWDTTDVAIWSSVEPGIGITALSLATLRPLFRKFLIRIGLATRSDDAHYDFYDRSGPTPTPNGFPLRPPRSRSESSLREPSKGKGKCNSHSCKISSWRPKVPSKDYHHYQYEKDGYLRQNSNESDVDAATHRGIAPQMGNTSHVEGGLSRKPSAAKLKKGASHSRSRCSSRGATLRGSGSDEDLHSQFEITKTTDVVTWSGKDGDELIKVGWDGKEVPGIREPERARRMR